MLLLPLPPPPPPRACPHLRAQVLVLGALPPGAHLSALPARVGSGGRASAFGSSRSTSQQPFPPLRLFGVFQVLDSIAFLYSRVNINSEFRPPSVEFIFMPISQTGKHSKRVSWLTQVLSGGGTIWTMALLS